MESTRPIRALIRGLEALTVLNVRDGASVTEIAREIRLPRTTVYRILETLADSGFIARQHDRYRLLLRIRELGGGVERDRWVTDVGGPQTEQLGRELVWPVCLATLDGRSMLIRASSDHGSPLALERLSAGMQLSLTESAAGRCVLAFCPPERRAALLERADSSGRDGAAAAEFDRLLAQFQAQGFAQSSATRRLVEEVSLAVPIEGPQGVAASLSVRFNAAGLPLRHAVQRLVPRLQECAARIRASFEGLKAGPWYPPAQPVS